MRFVVFGFLFIGFYLLFGELRTLEYLSGWLKRTRSGINEAARQRSLADRQRLLSLQEKHSGWHACEKLLRYSGLRRHYPKLTAEWWIMGNMICMAGVFVMAAAAGNVSLATVLTLLLLGTERVFLEILRRRNYRRTEENLSKLLDFLANYSIASGEITGIFEQISRYMEEPLGSVLDACSYEAATTGDVPMALLTMGEQLEHPKFKELARSMEISVRYCADFSALVDSSRRSLREYLRMAQQRRTMLQEAMISLALLMAMSAVVLLTVGRLTGAAWAN